MSERYCWSKVCHWLLYMLRRQCFPGPSSIVLRLPSLSFLINRWLYVLLKSQLTVANCTELRVNTAGVGTEHKLWDQLQQVRWQGLQYWGGLQSLAAVSVARQGPDSKDVIFTSGHSLGGGTVFIPLKAAHWRIENKKLSLVWKYLDLPCCAAHWAWALEIYANFLR